MLSPLSYSASLRSKAASSIQIINICSCQFYIGNIPGTLSVRNLMILKESEYSYNVQGDLLR